MICLLLIISFIATVFAAGESCSDQYGSGTCGSPTSCLSSGSRIVDKACPGDNSNKCCLPTKSCTASGQSGMCRGTSYCSGTGGSSVSGACPGPSSVQCCLSGGGNNGPSPTPVPPVINNGPSPTPVPPVINNGPSPTPVPPANNNNNVAASTIGRACSAQSRLGTCQTPTQCTQLSSVSLGSSACQTGQSQTVQCCVPQVVQQDPVTPVEQPQSDGVGTACTAHSKTGSCQRTAVCRARNLTPYPYQAGVTDMGCRSIQDADIQCCAPAPPANAAPSGGATTIGTGAGCAGLVWPLQSGSLARISVNWGGPRTSKVGPFPGKYGGRCHCGLDLYTTSSAKVVAVDDGVVSGIITGWYPCSGGRVDAIFVYHESGVLQGQTINYGEVNSGSHSIRTNQRITKGQEMGKASRCGMLHFELYSGRRSGNTAWWPNAVTTSGCHRTSMSSKPPHLKDPRPLLNCLKPSNARYHGGTSFLNDDADLSALVDEAQNEGLDDTKAFSQSEDEGLSTGAIAAISVVAVLVCCALIGLCAFCLLAQGGSNNSASRPLAPSSHELTVASGAYHMDDSAFMSARHDDVVPGLYSATEASYANNMSYTGGVVSGAYADAGAVKSGGAYGNAGAYPSAGTQSVGGLYGQASYPSAGASSYGGSYNAETMQLARPGAAGDDGYSHRETTTGYFKCDVCQQAYPTPDDVAHHKAKRH